MRASNITNKMVYELLISANAEIMQLKKQLQKSTNNNYKKLFYSYAEVAQLLCISVEGVRSKVRRSELIRTCSNNKPLIHRDSLSNYLKSQNPDFDGL